MSVVITAKRKRKDDVCLFEQVSVISFICASWYNEVDSGHRQLNFFLINPGYKFKIHELTNQHIKDGNKYLENETKIEQTCH